MMVANATHVLLEQVIIEDSPNSQAPIPQSQAIFPV